MNPIITVSVKSATRCMGAAWLVLLLGLTGAFEARAADVIGLVKTSKGSVSIERGGQKINAASGAKLYQSDQVLTGEDGAVGMTFVDNSRLSLGANSTLALEKFRFNTTTHEGEFVSAVKRGTLAAVSGKIARQTPEAMQVRTPSAILGVRGTKFVVEVPE
ncbi:MAG: FecR domain-containing protein [Alphaproteobacteria bacterium]